jgi:hypothetical protein
MDGNSECAEITATDTGKITVDKLVFAHENESEVVLLQTPKPFIQVMKIISGILVCFRLIGQTYTFSTGYSLGELSVQKGVPYTHWRELANNLIKERNRLLGFMPPKVAMSV